MKSNHPIDHRADSARAVSEALARLARPIRSTAARDEAGCPVVTPAQGELVLLVAQAGATGISVKGLADALGVSSSAVTQMVDGLVVDGILARTPDPEDRRAVRLRLTAHGHDLYERFDDARLQAAERLLEPLDDADVATLAGLLSRIASAD